jgi:hypothetical protein
MTKVESRLDLLDTLLPKINEFKKISQKPIRNPNIVHPYIFRDKEDAKTHKIKKSFGMFQTKDLRPEGDFGESDKNFQSIVEEVSG